MNVEIDEALRRLDTMADDIIKALDRLTAAVSKLAPTAKPSMVHEMEPPNLRVYGPSPKRPEPLTEEEKQRLLSNITPAPTIPKRLAYKAHLPQARTWDTQSPHTPARQPSLGRRFSFFHLPSEYFHQFPGVVNVLDKVRTITRGLVWRALDAIKIFANKGVSASTVDLENAR